MRRGLSVEVKEREGDPARGPARYSVRVSETWNISESDWNLTHASAGTSEVPCDPSAVPLTAEPEVSERTWFAVTVPRTTSAPALDLTLQNKEDGRTQCIRIPVEGEEIEWRRL